MITMRICILACFMAALQTTASANPDGGKLGAILTFFFKPTLKQESQDFSPTFSRIHGIYVIYHGMVTHSDFNGQVIFPLQQMSDTLQVIVTNAIRPVLLFGNTVHHLELEADHPAAFYTYHRTVDEEEKTYRWEIKKNQTPPKKHIPDDALVIIAKPSDIIMHEGLFITEKSANVILPPLSVVDTLLTTDLAFQFLKVAKFFEPVHKAWSFAPDRYATLITNAS